jgi:murein DD-endopeptidase MepM/ murein hydrolase activator NlpD
MVTQNMLTQARKLKLRWFVTVSTLPLLGVVTAFGVIPQSVLNLDSSTVVAEQIALPNTLKSSTVAGNFWRNERVQRGDTVAELLRRMGVEDAAASAYLRTDAAADTLRQLSVGKEIQAEANADGSLLALRYLSNSGNRIVIEKAGDSFKTSSKAAEVEQRVFMRTGEIKTSLFAATDAAGLPENATTQLTEIFSGDVDFHHDLHRGDKFTVVYEMTYSNGEPVRAGRILAAEFINRGKAYSAVYFQTSSGHGDYFTPNGKSIRKAFLRSPIEFARVSSGFTSERFHPILNKWRAHKGVDFAAAMGTKVKVTSDGTVSFVGQQSGYGNVVMISHQGRYSTVYGHLSRFGSGLRAGSHVNQGDVIGYVGMTGYATGPHLHYEFKIDGQQRDPLRVALPNTTPVAASQMTAFREATHLLNARLDLLHDTRLAKLD